MYGFGRSFPGRKRVRAIHERRKPESCMALAGFSGGERGFGPYIKEETLIHVWFVGIYGERRANNPDRAERKGFGLSFKEGKDILE